MSLPLACGDRSGFLFAHACDRPAAGACRNCGHPICIEHTRVGATGPTCISCLRGEPRDESSHDRGTSVDASGGSSAPGGAEEAGPSREGQFGGAGASALWQQREGERAEPARADDPYFFAGGPDRAAYYDADDYRAFDAATAASAAESAGGGAGGDAGEADDAPDTDTGAS